MKFRWIGDPNHDFSGPDVIEKWEHVFNRVDWTEVKDAEIIRKLLGHSHFESAGAFPVPDPAPVVSDERESLIREAEELGIAVDRRWSNLTLSAKIRESRQSRPYSGEGLDEDAQ